MKIFMILFLFLLTFAVNCFSATEIDRQEQVVQNFYGNNPGFESGTKDITTSSSTKSWEGTTKHLGNKALKCTFDATNDYCETKLVANPQGVSNLEWGFFYSVSVSTVKAEIIDGSGNIVRVDNPLPSTTGYQERILEFVGAASTSYKLRLTATSGAATIYVDTMHVSKNMNIGSVNQVDKQYSQAEGHFTVTGTNWTTSVATAVPYKTRNNKWRLRFNIVGSISSGSSSSFTITMSGVTSISSTQAITIYDNAIGGRTYTWMARFDGSGGDITALSPTTVSISNVWEFSGDIELASKPTWATDAAAETVARAESANQSWSGFHGGDCSWTRNAASFADSTADASCTFTERINNNFGTVTSATSGSDKLPGLVLTPNRTGTIEVCSLMGRRHTTSGEGYVRLTDGTTVYYGAVENATTFTQTTLCGQYNVSTGVASTIKLQLYADTNTTEISGSGSAATSASVSWSVKWVYPTQAMPQIVNSVSTNYLGRFVKEEATLNCDASSAITSQLGSWISSIGNISSGVCAVTLTTGIFATTPRCRCFDQSVTLDSTTKAVATSATAVSIVGTKPSDGTALTSFDCVLECSEGR